MKFFKMNLEERREMILNSNIIKTLIILSIPTILMGFVQTLIPFTDSIFLNNKLGSDVGAAVSYTQPMLNTLLSISQGIGVVSMSMIGQLNGSGDKEKVKSISLQILVFGFLLGLILIPISIYFSNYISPNDIRIKNIAIIYFSLNSLVIPFQFMAAIFNSIKSSIGESEATFYRMIVLLFLKIFFNYVYLSILNLGIKGAVFASVSAYILTTLWMYYDLFIKNTDFKLNLKDYKFDKNVIKELIKLSIPSILSYMSINLGFFLINIEIIKYGTDILAGITIASQINSICFIMPTSIATTITAMISINIGNKNIAKAKEVYEKGKILSMFVSLILMVFVLFYSEYIIKIFDVKFEIENVALEFLKTQTYSVIPYSIVMSSQSVYNALGKNTYVLVMSFLRIWLFRYIFIIITSSYLSYYSIFYGNLFSNILSAIILYIMVKNSNWKNNIEIRKEKK